MRNDPMYSLSNQAADPPECPTNSAFSLGFSCRFGSSLGRITIGCSYPLLALISAPRAIRVRMFRAFFKIGQHPVNEKSQMYLTRSSAYMMRLSTIEQWLDEKVVRKMSKSRWICRRRYVLPRQADSDRIGPKD